MTTLSASLATLLCAALFDVQTLPVDGPGAKVLLIPGGPGGGVALALVSGLDLRAVDADGETVSTVLPPDTYAFDVADTDGDGRPEVIAVTPSGVYLLTMARDPAQVRREFLFDLAEETMPRSSRPESYVLFLRDQGVRRLVLPRQDALELRDFEGNLVERYPFDGYREFDALDRSFLVWSMRTADLDGSDQLWLSAVRMLTTRLGDTAGLPLAEDLTPATRVSAFRGAGDASALPGTVWPRFPLAPRRDDEERRVIYAVAGQASPETLVRLQTPVKRQHAVSHEPALESPAWEIGPVRRYPGSMVGAVTTDLPDFNGDGYTDIFLWQSPTPGLSVSSMARVLTGGTWDVRLTAHLFAPDKNRYEPRPHATVTVPVPIHWFLAMENGAPVRSLILKDFRGNGATDFACVSGPSEFSVWLYSDGFAARPDFVQKTPGEIRRVTTHGGIDSRQGTAVVLESESAAYLLRPAK